MIVYHISTYLSRVLIKKVKNFLVRRKIQKAEVFRLDFEKCNVRI
ncbi:hypothetical protein [Fervidobacterium pennivorans]|nr:hypothetical protein [Fervidobacterium pennivorans]